MTAATNIGPSSAGEFREERGQRKRDFSEAKRNEEAQQRRLAAVKRMEKMSGKVAKKVGGEVGGRGAQATTFAAGLPVQVGADVGTVLTAGALAPVSASIRGGRRAAEQAAYQAGKRVARPIAKQVGKAPYKLPKAIQKGRVAAARRGREQAQRDLDEAGGLSGAERLLGFLTGSARKFFWFLFALPFELAFGLIMIILGPIIMLILLILYIIVMVVPFYSSFFTPGT
jgi:hypothetical protein